MFITELFRLLRILWPFLKEIIFQGMDAKEWMRHNRTALIWLAFLVIMLMVVMYLIDTLRMVHDELRDAKQTVAIYESQDNHFQQRLIMADAARQREVQRAESLERERDELKDALLEMSTRQEMFKDWLINCGINPNYSGPGYPQCRIPSR